MKARIAALFSRSRMRRSHTAIAVAAVAAATLALGASLASAVAPVVTIDPASEVSYDSAKASGTVNPEGGESSCRFEYTTLASFEAEEFAAATPVGCESAEPLTGSSPIAVSANLEGLNDDTEYRVRLVAENEGEDAKSSVVGFKTLLVAAPEVEANEASEVSFTSAKATGTVTPGGADNAFDSSCRFEYVTQAQFEADGFAQAEPNGQLTGCNIDPVQGTAPVEVQANLTGLTHSTTYHLRIVATNLGGTSSDEAPATFTTLTADPPEATMDSISEITPTTAHFAGTANPQGQSATARFEYSSDGGENWTGAFPQHDSSTDPGLAGGTDDVPVEQERRGLLPATDYLVRLRVSTIGGTVFSTPIGFTTETVPPELGANASSASAEKATLAGWVNPHGTPASYHFEYGSADCAAGPCTSTPTQSAGDGHQPVHVHAQIKGLEPNSTYHYRLIVESDAGDLAGPDRTIFTYTTLPEGRAYELVSPQQKQGNDVVVDSGRTRAAGNGDAVQFVSLGSFGDTQGTSLSNEYLSQRGEGGWATHGITPRLEPQGVSGIVTAGRDERYLGDLSADLSQGVFLSGTSLTAEDPNVDTVASNLYLRNDVSSPGPGHYRLLTGCPGCSEPITLGFNVTYRPWLAGTSEDFSHVFFTSILNLTSDTPPQEDIFCQFLGQGCSHRVYEYVDGAVRLVSFIPSGSQVACSGDTCEPALDAIAGAGSDESTYVPHAVSRDGSRVFFTVPQSQSNTLGRLYMRKNGNETVRIDASERAVPEAEQPAEYQDASADGSVVYFTTTEGLVDEDDDGNRDLYRSDLNTAFGSRLTLVSRDAEPADGDEGLRYVLGASDDGEYVYFVTVNQMVAGEPRRPPNGESLLFGWHDGEVFFVGNIDFADEANQVGRSGWNLDPKMTRLTPDGEHLLFVSRSNVGLTGADPGACDAPFACREIYVYSATASGGEGALECASCRPDGATAHGHAEIMSRTGHGATTSGSHLPRAISDDGRRVFFTTSERLVPEDQNGLTADAYVYDVPSGQVSLLSSGRSALDSHFLAASASGEDVFFATSERLVGSDFDKNKDLYDARVGGGIPAQNPPPRLPACEGDGCQPPAVTPNDATPASAGFSGPGNATKLRCRKGTRRVVHRGKTRCVAKRKRNRANTERRTRR